MKQDEIIVMGLAGLALLLVFKATAKKTGTASGVWGGTPNMAISTPFGNPFGFTYTTQADQNAFNKLVGL